MIFQITNTKTSISIRNTMTGNSIALVLRDGKFETHTNVDGRDVLNAKNIGTLIKNLINNRLNKRMSYADRINKAAVIARKYANATTMGVLFNKIQVGIEEALTPKQEAVPAMA
jgi:hypothetical protein